MQALAEQTDLATQNAKRFARKVWKREGIDGPLEDEDMAHVQVDSPTTIEYHEQPKSRLGTVGKLAAVAIGSLGLGMPIGTAMALPSIIDLFRGGGDQQVVVPAEPVVDFPDDRDTIAPIELVVPE